MRGDAEKQDRKHARSSEKHLILGYMHMPVFPLLLLSSSFSFSFVVAFCFT